MIYAILSRAKLVQHLCNGSGIQITDESFVELDPTQNMNAIKTCVDADPFISEQASSVISLAELNDPENLCAACQTGADVAEKEKELLARIAATKTAVSALRRNMKDPQQAKHSFLKCSVAFCSNLLSCWGRSFAFSFEQWDRFAD